MCRRVNCCDIVILILLVLELLFSCALRSWIRKNSAGDAEFLRIQLRLVAAEGSVSQRSSFQLPRLSSAKLEYGTAILKCPVRVGNSCSFCGPAPTRQNGPVIVGSIPVFLLEINLR